MRFLALLVVGTLAGCNESGYIEPGVRPQIVTVTGPKDSVLACDPATTGGACPLPIEVKFRLPADQFVWKAYVRFQGDGTPDGVDRGYLLPSTYGQGDTEVAVKIDAAIPPTIVRRGALFTYNVRLVTGLGEHSPATKLNVTVQ